MQRSYQCCDAMGELVQAGTVKWDAPSQEWRLNIPDGKAPIPVKICPHCGTPISSVDDHAEECEQFAEVAEDHELYIQSVNGPVATPSKAWSEEEIEISYCPACGDELESGDPIKQQAD